MSETVLSPLQRYQHDIKERKYQSDPAQKKAIDALENLYQRILKGRHCATDSLYLWGSVGRGKTYVMDCFYQSLTHSPAATKYSAKRIHYYRFMQYLHRQLAVHQGKKDPLVPIAKALVKSHKILCLDEFFVSDIADAMLLGRLIKVLFAEGLVLVTTSNVEPCQLYKDGLQRDRFLPAIAVLEAHLQIIHMSGKVDHRLAKSQSFTHYYIQNKHLDISSHLGNQLYKRFVKDVGSNEHNNSEANVIQCNVQLPIESRLIACVGHSAGLYCFSFEQLFTGPRAANDYIALSALAQRIYIYNVPQMGGVLNERKVARGTEDTYNINQRVANRPFVLAKGDDEARRFISFIDEMYDQRKAVVLSCAVPLTALYIGGRVVFEFERTVSRIIEMQGDEYVRDVAAGSL